MNTKKIISIILICFLFSCSCGKRVDENFIKCKNLFGKFSKAIQNADLDSIKNLSSKTHVSIYRIYLSGNGTRGVNYIKSLHDIKKGLEIDHAGESSEYLQWYFGLEKNDKIYYCTVSSNYYETDSELMIEKLSDLLNKIYKREGVYVVYNPQGIYISKVLMPQLDGTSWAYFRKEEQDYRLAQIVLYK